MKSVNSNNDETDPKEEQMLTAFTVSQEIIHVHHPNNSEECGGISNKEMVQGEKPKAAASSTRKAKKEPSMKSSPFACHVRIHNIVLSNLHTSFLYQDYLFLIWVLFLYQAVISCLFR